MRIDWSMAFIVLGTAAVVMITLAVGWNPAFSH
jgi:hypothetical protein